MEKPLRYFSAVLAGIIAIASLSMVFAVAKTGIGPAIDVFGCNDIVQNIENLEINMTSVIYVKNSSDKWEEYQRIHGNENRIWVDFDKIPQKLIDAFVSIEDQRFYTHSGVDWKRTTSAFVNYLPFVNIYSSNQGGSTITQQLIKNLTSDNDKSASRKLREIARALIVEQIIGDKDKILEAYLNTISLGNGICGVQVASNYYFNKDVSELSLVECAALAGITKNPSAYNPDKKPEGNKNRRQLVLDKMLELGKITYEEYDTAYDMDVVIDKSQQSNFEIPVNSYFVDTLISNITEDLSEKYGCSADTASSMLYNGGFKIYATIEPEIQDEMESVYRNTKKYFSQGSRLNKGTHVESAMTVMDYEGHILGIVGGTGEKTVNRGLNRAWSSPRQPGSTMKPIGVYALAIDKGVATYSSVLTDKPLDNYYATGKSGPKEWYGYYAGTMTLQKALERSANTIPCWILKDLGVENSYNFLTNNLNMKHLTETDKNIASLALGGCAYGITTTESAAAYAIFGNGGKYFKPVTYYKVERATGETVLKCDVDGRQAISPATATIMNKLLQNVVYGSQGTGRGISGYSKMKAYAKTGTSSESNDLWMVAGTPYYVGSVWYGFDKPENVNNAGAAATVWKTIMTKLHKGLEIKEFEQSSDIITAKYCRSTGLLAGKSCYSTADGYYVPGVEVATCNGVHTKKTESETPKESTPEQGLSSSQATPSSGGQSSSSSQSSSSETPSSSEAESSSEQGTESGSTSSESHNLAGD
ncbi:MAG: transglycosylase domain-containing protein [Clostridia bacterium]|nr:transglycosylase domain-containing protein [Clostridia bacterium]